MARSTVSTRRSKCPVAASLDVLGDRWTLLVVRDLLLGKTRFKDFSASPEAIPTNILSERLDRLLRHKIVRQIDSPDGTKHRAYELTTRGRELLPMLALLRDWGLKWEAGTKVGMPDQAIPADSLASLNQTTPKASRRSR